MWQKLSRRKKIEINFPRLLRNRGKSYRRKKKFSFCKQKLSFDFPTRTPCPPFTHKAFPFPPPPSFSSSSPCWPPLSSSSSSSSSLPQKEEEQEDNGDLVVTAAMAEEDRGRRFTWGHVVISKGPPFPSLPFLSFPSAFHPPSLWWYKCKRQRREGQRREEEQEGGGGWMDG